jgi:glycosyltransferase involved in cell wall biosynthesis
MSVLIIGTDLNLKTDLKTQGQLLRDILLYHHVDVSIASKYRNPLLRILDTIYRTLSLRKNDIVIVQVYGSKSIYLEVVSTCLAKLRGCKVISTIHGGNIPAVYRSNRLKRILLEKIFNCSDTITAPSRYIPSQIPTIQNKFLLVQNHIDLSHYINQPKPQDCVRIFWMRSYHPTYNPMKAIQILEYIRNRNIEAKLIMAGKDFGQQSELINYVKSSKFRTDITIHDVIGNQEKNELATVSNIYLCTNEIDNAPVSFLEMMAMGLPIVTTNVGGIPLYVENKQTALISSDNSIEDMANLIVQLHQNKKVQQHLISNGLSFIHEYSAETVLQKWLTLIHSLLHQTTN